MHAPTTRDALALPFSEAADTSLGTVEAAIFVMLIDDVFEAKIACGETSFASALKICRFKERFSDTA